MALIDFHCHLTESGGYQALDKRVSLFAASPRVMAVTNRPSDWKAMIGNPVAPAGVTWALGLHPGIAHADGAIEELLRLLPSAPALGEVGLDYSSQVKMARDRQRQNFDRVLGAADTSGLLVSIHSRGATRDAVEALNDHCVPGAILHWFLGTSQDVERAIDADAFFSINEAMLQS